MEKIILNQKEIEYLYSFEKRKKFEMIENNVFLDVFVKDKSPFVRMAVAEQEYRLDILINDEHWIVRCAVARQKYGLDILINDESEYVRDTAKEKMAEITKKKEQEYLYSLEKTDKLELIKKGLFLDIFINDESHLVRMAVAYQEYRLDILINDEDYRIRCAVAQQGYRLDILVNDENSFVRHVAKEEKEKNLKEK